LGGSPFVVLFNRGGVVISEGPAFVGVDRGDSTHASWSALASRGISRGIGRQCQVSFRSFGLNTRYGQGRGNQFT